MKTLLQIVPRLAPAVDGVGDYAMLVAEGLRATHGIDTVFLVCEALATGPRASRENGFEVVELASREPARFAAQLAALAVRCDAVLLHYVGYGYRVGGYPFWLLHGLKQWRARAHARLLIQFHELFAVGRPWHRSFWTSVAQRHVFVGLVRIADAIVTSTRAFARDIQRHNRRRVEVSQLAIPSNVGEPADVPVWPTRANQMVVFGGTGWRAAIYAQHVARLRAFCAAAAIERIIDIGPGVLSSPAGLPCPIEVHGVLRATEVQAILLRSRYGGVSCPIDYVGKSGVFAAYASHAVVPVKLDRRRATALAEVEPNVHYVTAGDFDPARAAERVAGALPAWYRAHAVHAHAANIATLATTMTKRT